MATKNTARVIIGGKIITLGGFESEEYFQKVASYMNHKIAQLSAAPGYSRQPVDMKNLLLSLNIADDYFKAKDKAESNEKDFFTKDKEAYDLKFDVTSLQMRLDEERLKLQESEAKRIALEKKVAELENQVEELLK